MRLITSPPSRAECHEMWEPKPPGILWATPGLLRDSFTFTHTQRQCFMGKMCACLGIKMSRMRRSSLQGTDLVTERPDDYDDDDDDNDDVLTKAKLATFNTCMCVAYGCVF